MSSGEHNSRIFHRSKHRLRFFILNHRKHALLNFILLLIAIYLTVSLFRLHHPTRTKSNIDPEAWYPTNTPDDNLELKHGLGIKWEIAQSHVIQQQKRVIDSVFSKQTHYRNVKLPSNGIIEFSSVQKQLRKPPPLDELQQLPTRCIVVGHSDDKKGIVKGHLLEYNSRSFCRIGPICFDANNYDIVHDLTPPSVDDLLCDFFHVDGTRDDNLNNVLSTSRCQTLRRKHVQGKFQSWQKLSNPMEWLEREKDRIVWHPKSIIVPKYRYLNNIYHFNRIITFVMHVVWNFPSYNIGGTPLGIHLRAEQVKSVPWNYGMSKVTSAGVAPLYSLRQHDKKHHCFEEAVVLGDEGRFDSLHFLNDTAIVTETQLASDTHIPVISKDALKYKELVYTSIGLPSLNISSFEAPSIVLSPPPMKLVILDRKSSSKRHIDPQMREPFLKGVKDIADELGLDFAIYSFDGKPFQDQVAMMRDVGVAVGIHGANLQNSVFMPPLSAIVELFPYRYVRFYYLAGGNSGLRYSFHEAQTGPARDCSDLPVGKKLRCGLRYRNEKIELSLEELEIFKRKVRKAATYVRTLNQLGPTMKLQQDKNNFVLDPQVVRKLLGEE